MLLLQNTEILLYAGVAYVRDLKKYFWTQGHKTSQKKLLTYKKYINSPKCNTTVKFESAWLRCWLDKKTLLNILQTWKHKYLINPGGFSKYLRESNILTLSLADTVVYICS